MKGIYASMAGLLFAFVLFPAMSSAQDPSPKIINGGVLNGKAVSLPKPAYPAEAKEAKAEGSVAVDIEIDENGTVISAVSQPNDQTARKNDDGTPAEPRELHPALRTAAETAALSARFSPTTLSGEPVRVRGRIVYNFSVSGPMETKGSGLGGGVLNGKARSLPTPEYPPAALAVRAAGTVAVQVTVDEEGNVISASAVSGHPLLRAAAVTAAKEAKFAPVRVGDKPVKVSGVLTYNFAPGDDSVKPDNQ
jgi:TonB family protein